MAAAFAQAVRSKELPSFNQIELTTSHLLPTKIVGENRSRPNREETSMREMDVYCAGLEFPVIRIEFPAIADIFPVNSRREFLEKWLQRRGFLARKHLGSPQIYKIPCYFPC
jgi:hypothetical protein